jgi:hypothetical protein
VHRSAAAFYLRIALAAFKIVGDFGQSVLPDEDINPTPVPFTQTLHYQLIKTQAYFVALSKFVR